MPDPIVSVLVVNWNTRDHLKRCLTSLNNLEEADELEVIVVDNGSSDGSAEMVRSEFGDVILISNSQNRGFTAATNQAYARATGDTVLMLNSDTVISGAAIRRCHDYLAAHERSGAVGCRLLNTDGSEQSSCFRFPTLLTTTLKALWLSNAFPRSQFFNQERYGQRGWQRPTRVDVVMGSFLMVRRSAITSATLLDQGYFMFAEETDLCQRLSRDGFEVVFLPDIAITHVHQASSKTPAQRAWTDEAKRRGELRYLYVWRGVPTAVTANLIMLAGTVPRAAVWLAQDVYRSAREGKLRLDSTKRAGTLKFHMSALARPKMLAGPWGPPQ